MNIETKRLYKENIEEIIPLRVALQKYDFEGELNVEEKILEDRTRVFLEENLNRDLCMFGAYVNEELVSICGIITNKLLPQADDLSCKIGYITTVYTQPQHRRKGYQRRVFEECLEYGEGLGITKYKLSTKNPVAMDMCSSVGFENDVNAKKLKLLNIE